MTPLLTAFILAHQPGRSGWTLHHPCEGVVTLWEDISEETGNHGDQRMWTVPLCEFTNAMRAAIACKVGEILEAWS